MNNRRRAAFILALVMIFSSLPIWGGDVYASVLLEENSIITSNSDGEVLKTENVVTSDSEIELNTDTLDVVEEVQSTSENTTDLYCNDKNILESPDENEDTRGAVSSVDEVEFTSDTGLSDDENKDIPDRDGIWMYDPDDEWFSILVGQKLTMQFYGKKTRSEGMGNLEITKIPNTYWSYVKGKKAGQSLMEYTIEGYSSLVGFNIFDKNEIHAQYGELEHAKNVLRFDDFVEFYFRGVYKQYYNSLENFGFPYDASPKLFRVKELSTNKEYYLGENYDDTNYSLSEYLQPNIGRYEVNAIFPNLLYDPDREGDQAFYPVKGPEASAMTLEISSVGGGEQRLVPIPVTFTLTPKFIKLKPDYESEYVRGSRAEVMVEISPKDAAVDYVYWDSEGLSNVYPEESETSTFIKNGKLYAHNWIYASDAEGYDKITVSTGDGEYHDEMLVYVTNNSNYRPVTDLRLNRTNLTLVIGRKETEVLRPTVQPSNATDKNVEWSSDNPNVVKVDSNGQVTAVSVGTATVTASIAQGLIKKSCEVTVKEVEQYSSNQTIVVRGRITDERLARTEDDGRDYSIIYSDRGIASINDKGVITGQKAGHVTAKVFKVDSTHTIEIDVINPMFSTRTYTKNTGDVFNTGFDAKGLEVKYSSSNPSIAEIDTEGNVTAITMGRTVITAEVQGMRYTANVRVFDPQISGGDVVYLDGRTITLRVINGNGRTQWSSSDEGIATVDKNGRVKGVSNGRVIITAINNGRELKKEIGVYRVPSFTENIYRINNGEVLDGMFDDAGIGNVTYSSSRPAIASVDNNGKITGISMGTSRITAECAGRKYTTTVNVYSPMLTSRSEEITLLDRRDLTINVKDGYGRTKWTSSDESVATVNNGRIKALTKGTSFITAENNGRTMNCEIHVYNVPKFDQKEYKVNVGDSVNVAMTKDEDLTGIEYTVNNTKIAEIDQTGEVTGIKKGTVTVTAKIAGRSYTTKVKVL